jgi:cytochrome b involved in lipid metabolism
MNKKYTAIALGVAVVAISGIIVYSSEWDSYEQYGDISFSATTPTPTTTTTTVSTTKTTTTITATATTTTTTTTATTTTTVAYVQKDISEDSTKTTTYSLSDISSHKDDTSCWSTINGGVYDLTAWVPKHPGGERGILSLCGIDGSKKFNGQHGGKSLQAGILLGYKIGTLSP